LLEAQKIKTVQNLEQASEGIGEPLADINKHLRDKYGLND